MLLMQSLDAGELSQEWKSIYVSYPNTKKKRSDPQNYCPISLTCLICKVYTVFQHILVTEEVGHVLVLPKILHIIKLNVSWILPVLV